MFNGSRLGVCNPNQVTWQKNKANFGLAKKPNREGNKHNFGRIWAAKGLDMNASKVQAHTIVKNIRKKQNDQIQISATHRFYSQKKQEPTRATKLTKNFTKTTKQIGFAKTMYIKIPEHKKKQNKARKIARN